MAKNSEASAYTRQEQAHYDAIKNQEKFIRRLEYSEECAKRKHQTAKKRREEAQGELHEMIAADPSQLTLPGMDESPIERDEVCRWQETPLGHVIHDDKIVKTLAATGLNTLGQLASWTQAGESLMKLEGISEAYEAKIVESLQLYWRENPEIAPEEEDGDAVE